MKVCATIICHYGVEYFRQCIASIAPLVDRVVVVYTPRGSFGMPTNLTCPDTEEQLRACCDEVSAKLHWESGVFRNEGEHRHHSYALAGDADILLQPDTDEIWDTNVLARCLKEAHDGSANQFQIKGWFHFWRSFNYCCRDTWEPTRIIKPRGSGRATLEGSIYHFGYAQSPATVKYKIDVSGHRPEWRGGWFDSIFLNFPGRLNDLHPTTNNWWNAEAFDRNNLPGVLKSHPNFEKAVIE